MTFGLGAKLVAGFTLVFSVVFAAAFDWAYTFTTDRTIERLEADMRDTVLGAAAGIDPATFTALSTVSVTGRGLDGADAAYASQLDWLETVRSLEPRGWPFTYVPDPATGGVIVLADARTPVDPARAYAPFEVDTSNGRLLDGLARVTLHLPEAVRCEEEGSVLVGQTLAQARAAWRWATCRLLRRVGFTDAHGSWVAAYAPVRDADGTVVGGVALDFEMAYVDHVQNAILVHTGRAFLVAYGALFVLVLLAARVLTRPIVRLTGLAGHVARGEYDVDFGAVRQQRFRDQIGVLSDVLEAMVTKIDGRERRLREHVQELKIEIDEAKRSQQVSEIVDTDFFRDLQAKAEAQRVRHRTDAGSALREGDADGDGSS